MAKSYYMRRAACLTPMFCRPRRYVDLSRFTATAATQIAENVKLVSAFFLLLFLARCKKKEIVPARVVREKSMRTKNGCGVRNRFFSRF